jgi:signal transduction histidine kinase
LFFAFLALLAGFVLVGVTYGFARNSLVTERTESAERQAFRNADKVREVLASSPEDVGGLVRGELRYENGGFAVLEPVSSDIPSAVSDDRRPVGELPVALVSAVTAGRSGTELVEIDGTTYLVVGVHIAQNDVGYFEGFPATSTERTLTTILTALALGTAGTVVLATLFGWSISRRLLNPIRRVADAAEDIASGGLDTRLDPEPDPDLDRLATSFNEMADAVQTRIEREARFASDVSHELRSPITALSAAVEVLDARRDEIPERPQQALDVVVGQVRRFDAMVMDLLELSRLDAGANELNVEHVQLVDLVRRIAARYGAPDAPVEVMDGTPVHVDVDKVRLERIVGNLVENATHHAGGVTRIELVPTVALRYRIAVEDDGPGVSPSERERIFERFARGSAARHRIGTGLGLALVAEHAEAMHGHAWVEDAPGGGARFVVELPESLTDPNGTGTGAPSPSTNGGPR